MLLFFLFSLFRFPLYPKGGEKLQFEYGVYLLNKNIAQVGALRFFLLNIYHLHSVTMARLLSCVALLHREQL